MPLGGFAWGTSWKFPTFLSDYSFETTNATGEDRLVKATIPMTTKATLLMPNELRQSTIQKSYSVKKVSFASETETFDVETVNKPAGGYKESTGNNFDKNK